MEIFYIFACNLSKSLSSNLFAASREGVVTCPNCDEPITIKAESV